MIDLDLVSHTDFHGRNLPPLGFHDVGAGDVMGDLVVKSGVPRDERLSPWSVVGGVG